MLRIIRIALLVMVPTIALGTLVSACSDDTTSQMSIDMATTGGGGHDMAGGGGGHDMAMHQGD